MTSTTASLPKSSSSTPDQSQLPYAPDPADDFADDPIHTASLSS
eukprot:CAMPEP_0182469502 /NCGR_PEP_ID=MMETSP1319-20130603/17203_1 /TAXON_ID=172717 /ORGANISM="Bolidomonas pacifica, Strain RCC208" /LENGTH=43 /DNA_ID= /DNA_START= /DNA_END= /DNA_ORIENTATION=